MSGATRKAGPWILAALVGATLLLASGCGGGKKSAGGTTGTTTTPVARGGTYVVELATDVDYTDPGLDYLSTGWEIQYAVGCKLLNYPDKNGAESSQLEPEVATGFPKVSDSGKTYTFTIRKGYRFNTGQPVTAQSFADALNRDASPTLQSPAQAFLADVVGAQDVFEGKAKTMSGVMVDGDKLTIELVKAVPTCSRGSRCRSSRRSTRHSRRTTTPTGSTLRLVRPVLHRRPHCQQLDHAHAQPLLHGPAAAQPERDRLQDRQHAGGDRAEHRVGHRRLRRERRRPAELQVHRRQVRCEQGALLGRAPSSASNTSR